jgi:hypothetical protein
MRNLVFSFALLASGGLCSSPLCLAQERPRRAGTHNRVVAALTWPVRSYYIETKETFRDMREDQMLRAEAVALFGAAAFGNASLEVLYHQNARATVGDPARFFIGHRPHGVQLWLVSGAANVALLDAAHYLSRDINKHRHGNGFARYGCLAGIVGLSAWYTAAGVHNLDLKNPPVSPPSSTARLASH